MMLVGVTGNIGSGKTTVCQLFRQLGVPVYYADERGKYFLKTPDVRNAIRDAFGDSVLNGEGGIDRKKLASLVFSDRKRLSQLNALIHPLVRSDFQRWAAKQTGAPYVIQEAAILIESGQHKYLDKIILVQAPEAVRIKRVCERDGASADQVRQRAKHQMPEAEKGKHADLIIVNDGQQALIPQVNDIHRTLCSQA